MSLPTAIALATLSDGPPCPSCGSLMTPWNIATWRNCDVCLACLDDLTSHDAEEARRAIREFPMRRVTLTLAEREP